MICDRAFCTAAQSRPLHSAHKLLHHACLKVSGGIAGQVTQCAHGLADSILDFADSQLLQFIDRSSPGCGQGWLLPDVDLSTTWSSCASIGTVLLLARALWPEGICFVVALRAWLHLCQVWFSNRAPCTQRSAAAWQEAAAATHRSGRQLSVALQQLVALRQETMQARVAIHRLLCR